MLWNRNKGDHHAGTRDTNDVTDRPGRRDGHGDDRMVTDRDRDRVAEGDRHQRDEWGGMNLGAGVFGWLVAIGMAVLLSGIIGAIASAVGNANDVTQSDLERQSGTISITAAIVLLVVLLISFYTGGYVAGRMSRFDGGRQGLAVWLISLAVVIVAAALGAIFGNEYDIMNRVDVPDIPVPTDDLTLGGAITIAAAILGTLLAALAGGKAGTHYHRKVDRTW